MYDPKGNSKDRAVEAVEFREAEAPGHLRDVVHRFLELKTTAPLSEDYRFHALPDACTYIIFDQQDPNIVITHPLNMGPDGCADAIYGDLFATRAN